MKVRLVSIGIKPCLTMTSKEIVSGEEELPSKDEKSIGTGDGILEGEGSDMLELEGSDDEVLEEQSKMLWAHHKAL